MEYKDALMVLESMRDQRLSLQVLNDLIVKASEANSVLAGLDKKRSDLEADIANIEVVKKRATDELEKFKADLARQVDDVSSAKGKLEAVYNAAVDRARQANEAADQAEASGAKRLAEMDKAITDKQKQLDKVTADLQKIAKSAASMAA
jgi:chromosome segregation ATPase